MIAQAISSALAARPHHRPSSPYAINNSDTIAGLLIVNAHGGSSGNPAIYQNGQVTDPVSKVDVGGNYYDSRAIAINQKGDLLITVQQSNGGTQAGPVASYLYNASTGQVTNLSALPGGSGMIAAALNTRTKQPATGSFIAMG